MALGGRIELASEEGRAASRWSCLGQSVGARSQGARGGPALFDAVDDGVAAGRQVLLEVLEPRVDALPPGGDEVDEQREVVDARVPLGADVALEPPEPAQHLVHQARALRQAAAQPAAPRCPFRHARRRRPSRGGFLRTPRRDGERLETFPRAFEHRFEVSGRIRSSVDAATRSIARSITSWSVADRENNPAAGCVLATSITSFRLELIAQHPTARRDESRLLVFDRSSEIRHRRFSDLPDELCGELAVVNDTRVSPGPDPDRTAAAARCCWSSSKTGSGRRSPDRRAAVEGRGAPRPRRADRASRRRSVARAP